MSYVLGIDLGTSSLKGLLMNKKGEVVAQAEAEYQLSHPAPGFSEQDPREWIIACGKIFKTLSNKVVNFSNDLKGVSISGQMHSLVILDEDNQILRPAILWNDVRTTKQCQEIQERFGEQVLTLTKNIPLEGFTLPKILWIQENEPDIWKKVRKIMLPKDYLGFWLTGNVHTDYSDAAGTLMLDIEAGKWAEPILEEFGIAKEFLPTLIDSTGEIGKIRPQLLEELKVSNSVKVYAGGADNACAAVGAGILDESVAMASIGTSGVFLSLETSSKKNYQGKLHLFSHAIPNKFYAMGVTLAAGHSLNWFKETFAREKNFDELLAGVGEIPVGSKGLLFSPYIVGERTPYVDSSIRGSFIGVDTNHTLTHFSRAVLEGITFSLKDSQVLMEEVAGKDFQKIVSVGGGAKNRDWLQIQADIFNAEIVTLKAEQGPSLGAAMLAAVGLGWFSSLEDASKVFVSYQPGAIPNPNNVSKYAQLYELYRDIYPATADICRNLASYR